MANMDVSKLFARGAFVMIAMVGTSATFATEASKDGSSLAAEKLIEVGENSTMGRALLKAEDLKRLLGPEGKMPASSAASVSADAPFMLEFSKQEVSALHRRIGQIEGERTTLLANLSKEAEAQKTQIRSQRREIQGKRLSARDSDDNRLSKSLYENILQESNLEAQIKHQLEDFDRTHLVSIDFMQLKGQRYVQSISIGPRKVWALESRMSVAKK